MTSPSGDSCPPVGTANVDATLSTSLSAVSGVSTALVNVNQTSPTGTIETTSGGSAGAQSLSTTTAGSASDLNLSALGWRDDTSTATPGGGQTQLGYGEGGSGSAFAVTQVSEQDGGAVSDSWSWTDPADASVEITVPVRSASADGATTPVMQSTATYSGTSSASSATWSHTIGAGANRYLYVAITTNAAITSSVTGVTYDGTAMTKLSDVLDSTSAGKNRDLSVWGLVAPTVGTANVVATFAASYSAVSAVSVGLINVNQSTPTGTIETANGGSPGAQSLSTTTAGNASDLNLSALGWRNDIGVATPGAAQTLLGIGEGGSGSNFAVTQASEQNGGAVTDSWSWTDPADSSDEITVPIKAPQPPGRASTLAPTPPPTPTTATANSRPAPLGTAAPRARRSTATTAMATGQASRTRAARRPTTASTLTTSSPWLPTLTAKRHSPAMTATGTSPRRCRRSVSPPTALTSVFVSDELPDRLRRPARLRRDHLHLRRAGRQDHHHHPSTGGPLGSRNDHRQLRPGRASDSARPRRRRAPAAAPLTR